MKIEAPPNIVISLLLCTIFYSIFLYVRCSDFDGVFLSVSSFFRSNLFFNGMNQSDDRVSFENSNAQRRVGYSEDYSRKYFNRYKNNSKCLMIVW
jgi:hypothetical protein